MTTIAPLPTFLVAMKNYFGYKPSEGSPNGSASEFMQELKGLNDDDRAEFSRMLTEAGFPHQPPAKLAKK